MYAGSRFLGSCHGKKGRAGPPFLFHATPRYLFEAYISAVPRRAFLANGKSVNK